MSTFRDQALEKEVEVDPAIMHKSIERIGTTRARLLLQQPFYGVLLSMVDFIPETAIPTMATDGAKVYYNPIFVDELTNEEIFGVILHEISHCIYLHCTGKRRLNREHKRWNFACFPAGTILPGSFKRIESVSVGDSVIGMNGQKQSITKTMVNDYDGDLFTIGASGLLPFKCTEEHPIKVVTRKKGLQIKFSEPTWKTAKDINIKNDYLVVPILKGTNDLNKIDLSKYSDTKEINEHDQYSNIASCIKNEITLDENFAWLMGVYAAEGLKPAENNGTSFSLNVSEGECSNKIQSIIKELGYHFSIIRKGNTNIIRIVCESTILSRFFEEHIGHSAENKEIPKFILFNKNKDLPHAFLKGLFDSSGFQINETTNRLCTVSLALALQTQMAIGRLGFFADIRRNNIKERVSKDQVFPINFLYNVSWTINTETTKTLNSKNETTCLNPKWKKYENNYLVPVTHIEKEHFCDKVYNIGTDDHTYTVSNALVHNCDFAVNLEIKGMGYSLPPKCLLDQKYSNMNAEQIYDQLPEDEAALNGLGSPFDMHIDNSDESSWDDMEDKIITAYEMTKNQKGKGNTPAGLKRWIDKLRKSKVRWERIFHRYVGQALAKDDYSFTRVNKRFLGQDMYLPDLRSNTIGDVVIAIDTSGSIGRNCLEQFAAEIYKISHLVNEIVAISCDCAVQEVVKVRRFENFLNKLQMKGGGGTDFRPVFDKIKEMKMQPDLFIYLTDAYGSFPEKHPNYPVLWCVTAEDGMSWIPWGQKVLLPNKEGEW